jgi:hypothetical protein
LCCSFSDHRSAGLQQKPQAARVRLKRAQRSGWITFEGCADCVQMGNEIGRMLGGWIKDLDSCDWKDRGRFQGRD